MSGIRWRQIQIATTDGPYSFPIFVGDMPILQSKFDLLSRLHVNFVEAVDNNWQVDIEIEILKWTDLVLEVFDLKRSNAAPAR